MRLLILVAWDTAPFSIFPSLSKLRPFTRLDPLKFVKREPVLPNLRVFVESRLRSSIPFSTLSRLSWSFGDLGLVVVTPWVYKGGTGPDLERQTSSPHSRFTHT